VISSSQNRSLNAKNWRLCLTLIEEDKLTPVNAGNMDVTRNIRILPIFEESNVDTFLTLFEGLVDLHDWPDSTQCLLLQCVLSGSGAQAYAALGVPESRSYSCGKKALLKTYELVPEAYR
jgi:hypothetical protein